MRRFARHAVRAYGTLAPGAAAAWFEGRLATPPRLSPPAFEPPCAPARVRHLRFGAGRVVFVEYGAGPAVLLVHGWGGSARSFWRMVDPIVARGLRAVTVDLPAHGESDGRRTNMPECAEAVSCAAQELGPLHAAVGHSFGGPTAALALARGAAAGRLVLVAPPRSVHDALRALAAQAGLPDAVFQRVARSFSQRLAFDWAELDTDHLVSRLASPVLVVHDEDDRMTPWSHGAVVARAARRGRLLTTAGLGHRAVLADPHVTAQVAAFLTDTHTDGARPAAGPVAAAAVRTGH